MLKDVLKKGMVVYEVELLEVYLVLYLDLFLGMNDGLDRGVVERLGYWVVVN